MATRFSMGFSHENPWRSQPSRPQVPRSRPARGFPAPPELEKTPPKWIQLAGFLPIGEGYYID